MVTRKTQYAWMAFGGVVSLMGLILALQVKDGNRAMAQTTPPNIAPLIPMKDLAPEAPFTPEAPPPSTTSIGGAPLPPLPPLPPLERMEETKVTQPALPEAVPTAPAEEFKAPRPVLPVTGSSELPALPGPVQPPELTPPSIPSVPEPKALVTPPAPAPSAIEDAPKPIAPALVSPLKDEYSTPSVVVDPKLPHVEKSEWAPTSPAIQQTGATEATPEAVSPAPPSPFDTDRHEPPLANVAGPVQTYEVRRHGETLRDIARRTIGEVERLNEVYKLNPRVAPDAVLNLGTVVRLPVDACIATEDVESVKPLPSLRPDKVQPRSKEVVPLTGTFPCTLDQNRHLTLPRSIREQFDWGDTLLVSPGTDQCLWITNQAHLDRLGQKLEKSDAREADVRIFKRLYYAQTEKLSVSSDGRVVIPERFAHFAGLHQEVVLIGIDDHFELWDVARWRRYTQQQGPVTRSIAER